MARLFSSEYHEHSNTWYFKDMVMRLEKGDINVTTHFNERGLAVFTFVATAAHAKKIIAQRFTVFYDAKTKKIVEYDYPPCQGKDICPAYLCILAYAYDHLSTQLLDGPMVKAYKSDLLSLNEYWQRLLHNARIIVEGIYETNADKIRIRLGAYNPLDIKHLALLAAGQPLPEKSDLNLPELQRQLGMLSSEELDLLARLQQVKCAYSGKNTFFSVYKKDFTRVLPALRPLNNVFIKETGDRLVFASEPLSLSFYVRPAGESTYLMGLQPGNGVSVVFPGSTCFVLKKNEVYSLRLPFTADSAYTLFHNGLTLQKNDLVFLSAVVSRQLMLENCYLDFDQDIKLPPVVDSTPKVKLSLHKEQDAIVVDGRLLYNSDHVIPLSVLRYNSELVSFSKGESETWYFIPPLLRHQVFTFINRLPKPDTSRLESDSQLIIRGERETDQLKTTVFENVEPEWIIELSEELKKEFVYKIHLKPQIIAEHSDDTNWFEYRVTYGFTDVSFTHEELRRFFKRNEKFLKLEDGRLVYFSNKEAFDEVENMLTRAKKRNEDVYRTSIYNLPYLFQLSRQNQDVSMESDDYLDQTYNAILNRTPTKEPTIPLQLRSVMRSYQKVGYNWLKMLQEYRLSGILADDMGLGKTLQAVALLSELPADKVSLVICPKTLLFNWGIEIEKFNPALRYLIYEGNRDIRQEYLKNLRVNVVLASFSIIQHDLEELGNIEFEYVILDEAQHIKNPNALRSKAIKKLKANNRLALTGTPMENNPVEIWSIFDFLMPGFLPSLNRFKKEFVNNTQDSSRIRLSRLISPFILRRKKHEVLLELPDKQEQTVYARLTPLQEKIYMQVIEATRTNVLERLENEGRGKSYLHILAALTRLRQVCNHPALVEHELKDDVEISGKTELLQEIILDAVENGKKLLVFSQFVHMLGILRKMLKKHKIVYEYMDGNTKDRRGLVENFSNNEAVRVFLISLKTGGFGLNLTAADTVILVDPWWNPMGENQAIDRAYRIGQTKKVNVYKVVTSGTIEEKIVNLQSGKKELFRRLIEDGQDIINSMSIDELRDLFAYKL